MQKEKWEMKNERTLVNKFNLFSDIVLINHNNISNKLIINDFYKKNEKECKILLNSFEIFFDSLAFNWMKNCQSVNF